VGDCEGPVPEVWCPWAEWGYLCGLVKSHHWRGRLSLPNDVLDSPPAPSPSHTSQPTPPHRTPTLPRASWVPVRRCCRRRLRSLSVLAPGHPVASQWNTPATTNAIPCSVPSSDLPADRGVTHELRRCMLQEGMAANIEQLDRCALPAARDAMRR
jgi:hypothetical protein